MHIPQKEATDSSPDKVPIFSAFLLCTDLPFTLSTLLYSSFQTALHKFLGTAMFGRNKTKICNLESETF